MEQQTTLNDFDNDNNKEESDEIHNDNKDN